MHSPTELPTANRLTAWENPARIHSTCKNQVLQRNQARIEKKNDSPRESCTSTERTTSHSCGRKIVAPCSGHTHDLGISASDWTRCQMHQTGLDLNIVLPHSANLSTSEQYKVTVTYQEVVQHSIFYFTFRVSGKYTPTIQDLLVITCQSRQACFFSAVDSLEVSLPGVIELTIGGNLEWRTTNIQKSDLDAVHTLHLKIAQDWGLKFEDQRKSQKLHAHSIQMGQRKTQCSHKWHHFGPHMKTAW